MDVMSGTILNHNANANCERILLVQNKNELVCIEIEIDEMCKENDKTDIHTILLGTKRTWFYV